MTMLNALAAVQGGLQARETAFQGQASEQYRNALSQYGMEAPQTRQAFAAVDPRAANALVMQERQMTQQGDQFQQTMGLREREFEAQQADRQARLQITRQNAARQAMALTAQMSAADRAREAEVLERALATATTAQTPEDWDRIMTGFGEQGAQFVGQFERRDEIFAGVMGLTDALKARQGPEFRAATPEEAAQYGATAGQMGPGGRFYPAPQPASTNVTVNAGPDQSKFQERSGTLLADEAAKVAQGGAEARSNLRSLDRLEALLENTPTGGGAAVRQVLGNFGISTTGLSDIQAAQALINKLVPAQRPVGSGPMSDADLELFKQSMPRIINTPEGNRLIVETLREIAQYDIERGQIARDLQLNRIDPAEADRRWNALANPLEGFTGDVPAPAASPGRGGNRTPAAAPQDIPPAPSYVDPGEWPTIWQTMTPDERALFQ